MPIETGRKQARELRDSRRIGPAHVAVFYIAGQQFGTDIANYYKAARSIPDGNVAAINYNWDYTTDAQTVTVNAELWAVYAEMWAVVKGKNIHAIVLAGYWPNQADEGANADTAINPNGSSFEDYVQWLPAVQGNYLTQGAIDYEGFHKVFVDEYHKDLINPARYVATFWNPPAPIPFRIGKRVRAEASAVLRSDGYQIAAPTPRMLKPLDHEDRLKAVNDLTVFSHISNKIDGEKFVNYTVTRLTCSYVEPSDPDNADSIAVVKRMIDDGIAMERTKSDIKTAVISGSTTASADPYTVCADAYYALKTNGYSMDGVYWDSALNTEVNSTKFYSYTTPMSLAFPVLPSTYNLPGSNQFLEPNTSGVFNPISDVDIHVMGTAAYFSYAKAPIKRTDIVYNQGAISCFAQSYGAALPELLAIDPFYGTRNIVASVGTNATETSTMWDTTTGGSRSPKYMQFVNGHGKISDAFALMYIDTVVIVATAQVTSDNTIVLKESGTVVATINVTPNTVLLDMVAEIQAGLPPKWKCEFRANGPESRTMTALKNGACVAVGTAREPRVYRGIGVNGWMESMLIGDCLGEAMTKWINNSAFGGFDSAFSGVQNVYTANGISARVYGDPLYRPYKDK